MSFKIAFISEKVNINSKSQNETTLTSLCDSELLTLRGSQTLEIATDSYHTWQNSWKIKYASFLQIRMHQLIPI